MTKKFFSFVFILCLIISITSVNVFSYDSVTIRFSNIGNTANTLPPLENDCTVTGLMVSSNPMVKITDIASIMGASVSYSSNSWYITRNSQTTSFTKDSTAMSTSNSYTYFDPINGTTDSYTQTWSATLPVAAQEINGYKYVPLIVTAKQLGALLAELSGTEYRVYDFRINGTTPLSDSNDYIVGGSWLTDWSNKSGTNLSDHFDVGEMWSSTSYGYARQIKMAVTTLESAERVRHYYNGDSAMTLSCAFRSWAYNNSLSGSGVNSFHMRGRAWDCATDSLYTSVYNEFKNGQSIPISVGTTYWRSRIPTSGNSRGYEIEQMPQGSSTWLHLQRQPGYDDAQYSP